jgi:hypothetical protein
VNEFELIALRDAEFESDRRPLRVLCGEIIQSAPLIAEVWIVKRGLIASTRVDCELN